MGYMQRYEVMSEMYLDYLEQVELLDYQACEDAKGMSKKYSLWEEAVKL